MKLTNSLKPLLLLCCLIFSYQTIAQTYTPPSRELVEQLLAKIEYCKAYGAECEGGIKSMEDSPMGHSLEEYLSEKKVLESFKDCIENSRKKLDSLRKDYPGWFNSPSATMPIRKGHDITPRKLQEEVAALEASSAVLFERFQNIKKPEH